MIETNCPHCRKSYRLADQFAGRRATCKECRGRFEVPPAKSTLALDITSEYELADEVKHPTAPSSARMSTTERSTSRSSLDEYQQLPWHRRGLTWRLIAILGTFLVSMQCISIVVQLIDPTDDFFTILRSSFLPTSLIILPVGIACLFGPIYQKPRPTEQRLEPWPAWTRPFFSVMSALVVLQLLLVISASVDTTMNPETADGATTETANHDTGQPLPQASSSSDRSSFNSSEPATPSDDAGTGFRVGINTDSGGHTVTFDSSATTPLISSRESVLKLIESLIGARPDELVINFDIDALSDRVATHLPAHTPISPFKDQIRKYVYERGVRWVASANNGYSWQLKAIRHDGNFTRAMCRVSGEGGFDFVELILAGNPSIIIDWKVLSEGQLASEQAGHQFQLALQLDQGRQRGTLTTQDNEWLQYIETESHWLEMMSVGQHQSVINEFSQIPESIKRVRAVWHIALEAALGTPETEYLHLVESYENRFGSGPDVDFYRLWAAQTPRDLSNAILAIERTVGEDAYLRTLLSNACLSQGEYKKATEAARRAVELEPDLPYAWEAMMFAAIASGEYKTAINAMEKLSEMSNIELIDLENDPLYTTFTNSSEYQDWKSASTR